MLEARKRSPTENHLAFTIFFLDKYSNATASDGYIGGYWLRMHAIEQVIKQFLEQPSEKQKIVLNLGCG